MPTKRDETEQPDTEQDAAGNATGNTGLTLEQVTGGLPEPVEEERQRSEQWVAEHTVGGNLPSIETPQERAAWREEERKDAEARAKKSAEARGDKGGTVTTERTTQRQIEGSTEREAKAQSESSSKS
jgi:hypothetical protein